MKLTKEQKYAVRNLVKNHPNNQIQSLSGYAGTGKSTLVAVLKEKLPRWAVCAFTGKAAHVLRNKGISEASTIHSLIYTPREVEEGIEFVLNDSVDCEGFLVDEASMVSKELYKHLLSFKLPIIFIGDDGQLEPVGQDIFLMANPTYRLETIHRNAGEIAFFAEHIRKGGLPHTFTTSQKVTCMRSRDLLDSTLLEVDQLICAFNASRVRKNDKVRRLRGYTKDQLMVGDRVMCLQNCKRRRLFNGMQGEVVNLKGNDCLTLHVEGEFFKNVPYKKEQFGQLRRLEDWDRDGPLPFDYAYCITAHKSQGSQWPSVLVFEEICDKWDHKRWAYTAASRAQDRLIWVQGRGDYQEPPLFVPDWLKDS